MPIPYRKILFATDLSELSLEAWPHAVALAEKFGAELTLVCVIEEPFPLAPYDNYAVLLDALREVKPQLEKKLADLAKKAPPSVRTRAVVLEAQSAVRALLEQAKRDASDLIVVATHGRGGLTNLLLGSVAEKLLRMAPVPVLVVRPQKGA